MKLNLQRDTLLNPLQTVIGVVERRQSMPILSNVLLIAENNQLSLTASDTEIELIGQSKLEEAVELFRLTLSARKLFDICRALPEDSLVELCREKERIVLRSGLSRFVLSTLPAEDFPSVQYQEALLNFTLSAKDLLALLQKTHFAMGNQDARYYLNGALLEIDSHSLRVVATDGHRLAINSIEIQTNATQRTQIIIPRKGVLELMRLLNNVEEEITVFIGNSHIKVQSSHFIFTSKLIEGRFPDYSRVIPKGGNKIVKVDRNTLKILLSRAAILCNEKFKGIRFALRQNVLQIFAQNPEHEAAEEEMTIDYTHEDMDIGFNVNYLLDILNNVSADILQLIFLDGNSSLLVEEEAENKQASLFVVMPMRL